MVAQIYVDDIVLDGMSDSMLEHFAQQMKSEFEMSLVREFTYFLGLQVKQMDDSIFVCQGKYANSIVKKFGLDNASHKRTHAATHVKVTKDENGVDVDQSLSRSMIESLLHLTKSRPDITFCRGYCDADWAGSVDDRKSTSGGCFFLGNNLISWLQNLVLLSIVEAEYIVAGSSCT
ncbi:uncharacterized mitochondrial protein AtMg00810-like [Vicia villosa]|uniref:uncharacterized mitochondrial protein AtMg00810-like n=1 Tax=Vicia villosa TaxID=3911 RepID=UPI00273B9928|nr:uncharacterized mitochondrial protein AtMg00810-like [Vicia villosa]